MYNEALTTKELEVYNCIVYFGMSAEEIGKRLNNKTSTIKTHINSICNKFAITGQTRLNQLIIWHYQGVLRGREKMKNCTQCKYEKYNRCQNTNAEDYKEWVNEYMICREFKEKEEKQDAKLH